MVLGYNADLLLGYKAPPLPSTLWIRKCPDGGYNPPMGGYDTPGRNFDASNLMSLHGPQSLGSLKKILQKIMHSNDTSVFVGIHENFCLRLLAPAP